MRHFIYTKQGKINKTYGGEDYILTVYEVVKPGEVNRIGEVKRSTRGHKGENSEAWSVAWEKAFTARQQKALTKKMVADHNLTSGMFPAYYTYDMRGYGVIVEQI
jgi:hypothetical protein